jgi:ribose-phosphate pyrophosphokinase
MLVLCFDDYLAQGRRLATELSVPVGSIECRRFPDGESLVRLPEKLPPHVAIVRSLDRPNEKLVELLLAAEAARGLGALRVSLVAPYLCYMRQDMAFRPGEAVSQRIIGKLLAAHFDDVVTVDAHLHRIDRLDAAIPAERAVNVSAARSIGTFLRQRSDAPVIVGPDSESAQWVEAVAQTAGTDCVVGTKHRRGDREVDVALPAHDYRGRHAIIVDDIASTGRSVLTAARVLYELGVDAVDALVTHAIFAEDALEALHRGGIGNVWSTDSITHATNAVPLAPVLARAMAE